MISADPGAGTTLAAGQTVTLVVSLGEENKQVAVPNVFNMDENTAKQTLQDNSFKVNVETTEESSGAKMELCSQPERSGWNRGGSGNKYHHLYLSCAGSHTYAGNDDSGADSHTGSWKLEV